MAAAPSPPPVRTIIPHDLWREMQPRTGNNQSEQQTPAMIGSNRAAYGAWSQRGGAEREVVDEQPPKVEPLRHLGAAEESDGDVPPAAVEQAQVLCVRGLVRQMDY